MQLSAKEIVNNALDNNGVLRAEDVEGLAYIEWMCVETEAADRLHTGMLYHIEIKAMNGIRSIANTMARQVITRAMPMTGMFRSIHSTEKDQEAITEEYSLFEDGGAVKMEFMDSLEKLLIVESEEKDTEKSVVEEVTGIKAIGVKLRALIGF